MQRRGLQFVLKSFLDYVFPVFCLGCEAEGEFVCKNCVLEFGRCIELQHTPSFYSGHVALGEYDQGDLLGKIIHALKYEFVEQMKGPIQELFSFGLKPGDFLDFDYIVPAPLHKKRFAERGFNQAEIIAEALASVLEVSVLHALKRTRETKQQAQLDRGERFPNVENAFGCTVKDLEKKRVILVDDVFTTGATMDECAKALQAENVREIVGITLAKG